VAGGPTWARKKLPSAVGWGRQHIAVRVATLGTLGSICPPGAGWGPPENGSGRPGRPSVQPEEVIGVAARPQPPGGPGRRPGWAPASSPAPSVAPLADERADHQSGARPRRSPPPFGPARPAGPPGPPPGAQRIQPRRPGRRGADQPRGHLPAQRPAPPKRRNQTARPSMRCPCRRPRNKPAPLEGPRRGPARPNGFLPPPF